MKDTVNIRVYKDSHRRLKIKAAKAGRSLIDTVDELSK